MAGTPVERLTSDRALLDAMVATESALVAALADTGLVTRVVADVVADTCGRLERDRGYIDDLALRGGTGGNPAIPLVEDLRERVAATDPDAVPAVHRGATSQDVVDTALMLVARGALERLAGDLRAAAGDAATLAETHRSTVAVGRTLTQQALPTTFGFRVAGWLTGLTDAVRRVESVRESLPVQLGGPVGTTAAYAHAGPAVVDALAARLGLSTPVLSWHTRRTPVVDVGHALVVATGAVGKVAADVLVMSQTEIGELTEATGGSSSSMAHKANPAQSVL
ncbi:MAG: lyase family protein, partial [Nocardioidaceae bacterium]